jgi:hypothetical protein
MKCATIACAAALGLLAACSGVRLQSDDTRAANNKRFERDESIQVCRQNTDTTTYLDCKKRADANYERAVRETKP